MYNVLKYFFPIILFSLILWAAFYLGKKIAKDETKTTLIQNQTTLRKIAEFSALEVQGVSEINVSNTEQSSDLYNALSNLFFENTIHLKIPYTAKYGVDAANMKMKLSDTDSVVEIHFQDIKLLSYELKLNEAQTLSKSGWLVLENFSFLQNAQNKLYTEGRKSLIGNEENLAKAKLNLAEAMQNYFSPFGIKVNVFIGNEAIKYSPSNMKIAS